MTRRQAGAGIIASAALAAAPTVAASQELKPLIMRKRRCEERRICTGVDKLDLLERASLRNRHQGPSIMGFEVPVFEVVLELSHAG